MSEPYDYGLHYFAELRAFCQYGASECECPVCDAIFEIECLKANVSKWQSIAEQFAESDPRFEAFHRYFREVFPR